jgi:hypothetical protein
MFSQRYEFDADCKKFRPKTSLKALSKGFYNLLLVIKRISYDAAELPSDILHIIFLQQHDSN